MNGDINEILIFDKIDFYSFDVIQRGKEPLSIDSIFIFKCVKFKFRRDKVFELRFFIVHYFVVIRKTIYDKC